MFLCCNALLLHDEKQYFRHSAVKSEFMKSYIKPGRVDMKWNKFYQKLFDDRQAGDYLPTIIFEVPEISERLKQADILLPINKSREFGSI